jgi:SP family general alpha glucoside:H+ symporter-like MFS transporter
MLQWIWPPFLFFVGYFAPESPWYLVRTGKYEEAEKSLRRLARPGHYSELRMTQQLALMKTTNEREKLDAKNSSYADCFRGVNLRRTMVVCGAFAVQVWCGQPICSYATQFLQAAGMDTTGSFNYR